MYMYYKYFQCGVCYLETRTKSNFFHYIRSFFLFEKVCRHRCSKAQVVTVIIFMLFNNLSLPIIWYIPNVHVHTISQKYTCCNRLTRQVINCLDQGMVHGECFHKINNIIIAMILLT